MNKLLIKSGATLTLGILLATNPFSSALAEEGGEGWYQYQDDISSPSRGESQATTQEVSAGAPCSTGQGLEMSDCKLEYVTSNGAVLSWKTQWTSDTGYEVAGTPLRTDALTKLDKEGGQLTREHRVLIESNAIDPDRSYTVTTQGTAPNGHNGRSDALTLRPRPSGAFAPSAELPANLPTTMSGTVNVAVEVTGEYRDVSLFYALEGSNGTPVTSYRVAMTRAGNQQGSVSLTWDTTTVANGRYILMAAAQNNQGYSLGWSVRSGITVNNPLSTCTGNGPCNIAVTNAADPQNGGFAPGALLTIYGERLATTTLYAPQGPILPQELGGTRVWFDIDGVRTAGYLYFVSPFMVQVQLPLDSMQRNVSFGAARTSIEAQVRLASTHGVSKAQGITIRPFAPALFQSAGVQGPIPAMLHVSDSDPTRVVPVADAPEAQRAHAGEVVMLFGTGMGLSTVTVPPRPYSFAGMPAVGKPFFELLRSNNDSTAKLFIGSRELDSNFVRFGFKSPFMAGVDQINFVVPSDLPDGTYDIRMCFGTACSNVGKLPVTRTPARYSGAVRINSYVQGPSIDHAFIPTDGSIETPDEEGLTSSPSPYPTYEPTPSPTPIGDCSYGQNDCFPFPDPVAHPVPSDRMGIEPAWISVPSSEATFEQDTPSDSSGWDDAWSW